jgi:transcriptional regulator with XRE-family HTH domain
MASNKSFGLKVAEARKLVTPKMSQAELAKRLKDSWLDISPADIAEVEAGNRSLNYYQVSMLASALNTTVHQLLS